MYLQGKWKDLLLGCSGSRRFNSYYCFYLIQESRRTCQLISCMTSRQVTCKPHHFARPSYVSLQFGEEIPTCMQAAKAIGPRGEWGARATSYISVREAIRWSSLMPPQCATCRIESASQEGKRDLLDRRRAVQYRLLFVPDMAGNHVWWRAFRRLRWDKTSF